MDFISFDIETIPSKKTLTELQEEELRKRLASSQDKSPEKIEDLKSLIMATSPFLGEIVCIGMVKHTDTGSQQNYIIGTEKEILADFWDYIKHFNGTFVSFNGVSFDAPFILKRSMFHKILPSNNNFMDLKKFQKYPHFDVKSVFNNFDSYTSGTLDMLCEFLGVTSSKTGSVKGSNVAQAFDNGKIIEIAEYCVRDTVATFECFNIIKNYTK